VPNIGLGAVYQPTCSSGAWLSSTVLIYIVCLATPELGSSLVDTAWAGEISFIKFLPVAHKSFQTESKPKQSREEKENRFRPHCPYIRPFSPLLQQKIVAWSYSDVSLLLLFFFVWMIWRGKDVVVVG